MKMPILNFNLVMIYIIHKMLVLHKNHLNYLKGSIYKYFFRNIIDFFFEKIISFITKLTLQNNRKIGNY